jgi:hypothetical protein
MKTTLKIPMKCKVGFQERNDTYTQKLGYIIMFDGKTWRKEPSWEGWRTKYIPEAEYETKKLESYKDSTFNARSYYLKCKDQEGYYGDQIRKFDSSESYLASKGLDSIDNYKYQNYKESSDEGIKPVEFDNIPIEGFVLNRKTGGYSSGWNHRSTYCRVYDPRGWEFEISIPNLLYILENTNSIKGKGLDGEFVYSWDGKDLVLLPANTPDYEELKKFNEVLKLKLTKKELVVGDIYLCSDNAERTYMGSYLQYDRYGNCDNKKYNWFAHCKNEIPIFDTYQMTNIKKHIGTDTNYSYLMDQLQEDQYFKKPEYEEVTLKYLEEKAILREWDQYSYVQDLLYKDCGNYNRCYITCYKNERRGDNGVWGRFKLEIRNSIEIFKTLNDILNKNKLWLKKN